MTHGALFNGIAGFPLAASWAGIETIWTCEIDPFCNAVSAKHFPEAIQFKNIYDLKTPPYVDIISGGFPCQPFSVAGKQKAQLDDRHLWPEMLRIISEVKPAYVIGENVTGIIRLALDEVLASLENKGYTCETFVLPACAVNAPHRRDRVWIVAYSRHIGQAKRQKQPMGTDQLCKQRDASYTESNRDRGILPGMEKADDSFGQPEKHGENDLQHRDNGPERDVTNASQFGCEQSGRTRTRREGFENRSSADEHTIGTGCEEHDLPGFAANPGQRDRGYYEGIPDWSNFPTQSPLCGRNDGVPNRVDRIKSLGNAIVPTVAYQIFKAIKEIENE